MVVNNAFEKGPEGWCSNDYHAGGDAMAVARTIDAIYESSRSGRHIEIEYGF